ncbi:MFS transporter [Sulfolobus acidocaldarius DSM 639]|nr:MFS transporter [Sulfolobus acidocaldarius]WCM36003.1 MFS transporter [Sulfolobus acidocaldarius DSM 639]
MMSGKRSFLYIALTLSLIAIANRSTNNMVTTTLAPLTKYVFGFNNFLAGVLEGLIFMATLISTSLINPVLSPSSRRKVFISCNFLISVLLIGFYLSTPLTVWIFTAIAGVAYGLIMPNLVTSASLVENKRLAERLLSLYSTSLSISLIIGPLLESYVLSIFSYKSVFLAFLPFSILSFVLSWLIKFPDAKREIHGMSALRNKGFISSILSITTYNIPFAAFTTFITIYGIDELGLPKNLAYFSYIPFFITSFLTRLFMTIRPFRSLRYPLLISVVITILGIIGVVFSPNLALYLIFMALLGIPHGSVFPISTIIIARATSSEERNAVNSYFLAYNNILFFIVPIVVGALSQFIGLGYAFVALIIPVIITATVFFLKYWNDSVLSR